MSNPVPPTNERQRGQALVEYALILIMVSLAIVAILALVGPTVSNVFSNVVAQVNFGANPAGVGWAGGDNSSYVNPAGVGGTVCGNGRCEATENYAVCPADCGNPGSGEGYCGDGTCQPARGENSWTCALDCSGGGSGVCGDGVCADDRGEDAATCPTDCGTCGNDFCDPTENQTNCPADCSGALIVDCNDLSIQDLAFDVNPYSPSNTDKVRVSITNNMAQPVVIDRIVFNWQKPTERPNLATDAIWLVPQGVNWDTAAHGNWRYQIWDSDDNTERDPTPPTDTRGLIAGSTSYESSEWLRSGAVPIINAGTTSRLFVDFDNETVSGADLNDPPFDLNNFAFTVTFTNSCVITTLPDTPPATMTPNPGNPVNCDAYTLSPVTFYGTDQVRATLTNNSTQTVAVSALTLEWPHLGGNMSNDWIQMLENPASGSTNYIWSNTEGVKDMQPPTASTGNDSSEWLVAGGSPFIPAGRSYVLFNDFDDVPNNDIRLLSYPNQYRYRVTLNNGCVLQSETAQPTYTYITAEEGNFTINRPFDAYTDSQASGCFYVRSNGAQTNRGSASDSMQYTFDITEAGTYVIWAHVKARSNTSEDSLWVQVNQGSTINNSNIYNTALPANGYRVNFNDLPTTWNWVRVRDYDATNWSPSQPRNTTVFYPFTAGTYTLSIWERENNTNFDAVVITNDLAYTPPTPECTAGAPIFMEAEDARLNNPTTRAYDETYSGCYYAIIPEVGGTYDGDGWIEFTFTTQLNADYVIWGRATGEGSGADSFYVSVDGGYEYLWDVPRPIAWQRVKHDDREDGTYPDMNPVVFRLSQGQHRVRFRSREDGARLDAIVVVLNGDYTPEAQVYCGDVPTPTPQPLLTCNTLVTGNISNADPIDRWQFNGTAGTLLNLVMQRTDGTVRPRLRLLAPDGTLLVSNDAADDIAQVSQLIAQNGIYTVEATRRDTDRVGNYSLQTDCRNPTPQPMSCGAEVNESIDSDDWFDLYSFGAPQGAKVTIRMDRLSGTLYSKLKLYGPNGGAPLAEHDPNYYNAVLTDVTLPATGIYTIMATRRDEATGTRTGTYRLRLACQETIVLSCGKTYDGLITAADPDDYLQFDATAGDYVSITMYPADSSPSLDPFLELYRTSNLGSSIASNNDYGSGLAAAIDFLVDQTGSYTIRARSDRSTTGEYRVTLTCHQPQAITCNQVVTGALNNTDYYDLYTISVPGGPTDPRFDIGQFATSGTLLSGNGVRVSLFRTNLSTNVANGTDVGAHSLIINTSTADPSTAYIIRAGRQGEGDRSSDTGMEGTYELSVRCNWYVPPENVVTCNTPVSGAITDHHWYDYFTFNATAGQLISVTMYKQSGSTVNPYLIMYDPSGAEVGGSWSAYARDDDDGASNNAALRQWLVPADGAYLIMATRYNQSDINQPEGAYTLNVACNTPQTLACNETVNGVITDQDFIDRYTFAANSGAAVRVEMTALSGNLDSKLYLYRPQPEYTLINRQPQNASDGTQNATLTQTLDRSGVWEIWASRYANPDGTENYLDPSNGETTGTYRLTLRCDWNWSADMCATNLVKGALAFSGTDMVNLPITNTSPFTATLSRVQFYWPQLDPGNQFVDQIDLNGDIWGANDDGSTSRDFVSPTDTNTDSPYLTSTIGNRQIPAGQTRTLSAEFDGITSITGSNISQYRYIATFTNGCSVDTSASTTNCGNGVCEAGENALTCANDCPQSCGDGVCSGTENASTCAADCPQLCGDALCTGSETAYTCANDCPLTPTPISCGGSANQNITNTEWYDLYTFNGVAGTVVTITMTGTSGTLDPWLDLYGASMNLLASDDDSGGGTVARINYTLTATGVYTIRATRYNQNTNNNGGEGNYTLTLACVRCGDGVCSGSETNATCPGDCPVRCGDGVCSAGENVSSCAQDCYRCGDGVCTAGYETQYTCPVWNPFTGECMHTVAGAVTCGSSTNGSITNAEWFDMYSFSGTAGQYITLLMDGSNSDSPDVLLNDPYLILYDASGNRLAYNDDIGGSPYNTDALISNYRLTANGTYYIRATRWDFNNSNNGGQGNYTLTVQCFSPVRVSAGATSAYTSPVTGYTWQAHAGFSGGTTRQRTKAIAGTEDDPLYQTYVYNPTLNWSWSVPNGTYTVNLHFSEPWATAAGQRVFNINIEGVPRWTGFDIYAAAGARFTATTLSFSNVTVSDGTINIDLIGTTNNALVSAIEVTR